MKSLYILLLPVAALCAAPSIEQKELKEIGMQVWQNECRGTLDGLVTWNPNEPFPSLGIGHFIWYPAGVKKDYEEGFPAFIAFVKKQDPELSVPSWLSEKKACPWKTREEFLKEKRSKKVRVLRDFLSQTLDKQILFLCHRFEQAEAALLPHLSPLEKKHLIALKDNPKGIYALVDYVNFKGTGLSSSERYRGVGWGLLQVLQGIPENPSSITQAFAHSAKNVLRRRIRNAPPQKSEDRWLKGWHARCETYER